jgi:hypothetical protein
MMKKAFRRIAYAQLNSKQRENYNFAKLSAVMANYGFSLLRLSDDWNGADAIAVHVDGEQYLRIQLKGRGVALGKKYEGKNLWIACTDKNETWYVFPHDELRDFAKKAGLLNTRSWRVSGTFRRSEVTREIKDFVKDNGYLVE